MIINKHNYLSNEKFLSTLRHRLEDGPSIDPDLAELLVETVSRLEHLIDYIETLEGEVEGLEAENELLNSEQQ